VSAFDECVGLRIDEITPTRVTGWLELGPTHHQPFGLVHGGVYATVVESAASIGATAKAAEVGMAAVGVNNNTSFLRSMREGRVEVRADAVHQGRTQQLWRVQITDDAGRLVAVGDVRLQNVEPR
jgi:uncharacterized protein (TIGR00369 family)